MFWSSLIPFHSSTFYYGRIAAVKTEVECDEFKSKNTPETRVDPLGEVLLAEGVFSCPSMPNGQMGMVKWGHSVLG
jgi:hypothetical protein